jgi:acetyl esterase/lipase
VTVIKSFSPDQHYALQFVHPPANVAHIKRKYLDLPYAHRSSAEKLDIYLPDEGEGPYPVILSIHGGAFMGGDKADGQVAPMLEGLERGHAIVAVNYRLSWEARFPALVQDVKAAVRWVRANAQRYHLDKGKIVAWGRSAGGYLSVMLGTAAGVKELEDLSLGNPDQPCNVQAVVDWFGPTNFLTMDSLLTEGGIPSEAGMEHNGENSPESLLLGAQITKIPERVKAANPETYITPTAPPFFIQHGTKDATVPVQHSIGLAAKLGQIIGEDKVILELIDGADHEDPRFETPENVQKVLAFLDRTLRTPGEFINSTKADDFITE